MPSVNLHTLYFTLSFCYFGTTPSLSLHVLCFAPSFYCFGTMPSISLHTLCMTLSLCCFGTMPNASLHALCMAQARHCELRWNIPCCSICCATLHAPTTCHHLHFLQAYLAKCSDLACPILAHVCHNPSLPPAWLVVRYSCPLSYLLLLGMPCTHALHNHQVFLLHDL